MAGESQCKGQQAAHPAGHPLSRRRDSGTDIRALCGNREKAGPSRPGILFVVRGCPRRSRIPVTARRLLCPWILRTVGESDREFAIGCGSRCRVPSRYARTTAVGSTSRAPSHSGRARCSRRRRRGRRSLRAPRRRAGPTPPAQRSVRHATQPRVRRRAGPGPHPIRYRRTRCGNGSSRRWCAPWSRPAATARHPRPPAREEGPGRPLGVDTCLAQPGHRDRGTCHAPTVAGAPVAPLSRPLTRAPAPSALVRRDSAGPCGKVRTSNGPEGAVRGAHLSPRSAPRLRPWKRGLPSRRP